MALQPRPPVVTIMGHVDHGKTSLLDFIRQTRVAAGEAGGITQHIGAYQAEFNGQKITFIDTPGHAAFSKMRSRGAAITDIVVLVVAADDGVMPQTAESIQHIKTAGVPMIVAINKMDVQGASPEMVKAQLAEKEVYVSGYGGDVEAIELSAKTGQGVDKLLETLIVMGEVLELKADPEGELQGVVIESSKHKFRGPVATVLVQNGTLQPHQTVFADDISCSVRTMTDATGQLVESAGPSLPVEVAGFDEVPPVGATVTAAQHQGAIAAVAAHTLAIPSIEEVAKLRLIIKADFAGTLEAIRQNLVSDNLEVVGTGIGDVTESDILLAETTGARIITFQTKASGPIKKLADRLGVKIKQYQIIYDLLEDLQKQLLKLLAPEINEKETGRAEVIQIFSIRGEQILGCKVQSGVLRKGDLIHLKRGEPVIGDAKAVSLKQGKTDVDSVTEDIEFGLVLDKPQAAVVGDTVAAYQVIED
jgi:translation initiation factor IF-2